MSHPVIYHWHIRQLSRSCSPAYIGMGWGQWISGWGNSVCIQSRETTCSICSGDCGSKPSGISQSLDWIFLFGHWTGDGNLRKDWLSLCKTLAIPGRWSKHQNLRLCSQGVHRGWILPEQDFSSFKGLGEVVDDGQYDGMTCLVNMVDHFKIVICYQGYCEINGERLQKACG